MGVMRALRLLQTVIACAGLALGTAHASESITINYDALDHLPSKSSATGLIAPKLTPPGLLRHKAVPARGVPTASNAPLGVGNTIPPIFERNDALYNHVEPGDEASAGVAFGSVARMAAVAPKASGITGASTPVTAAAAMAAAKQETAMLTAPSFTQPSSGASQEPSASWSDARRVGEILFKTDGYEVLDLDRTALIELDRLAHRVGNAQQRILLRAFGGRAGDDSHEAHRMALRRGLAVRRYLIARGVSSDLIDVTAVGGATDGGPLDRVDVVASNT